MWRIRKKPTYTQGAFKTPMCLAIQRADLRASSVLLVNLRLSRPDNWLSPHQTAVTPALVCEIILGALADGWDPLATRPYEFEHGLICGGYL